MRRTHSQVQNAPILREKFILRLLVMRCTWFVMFVSLVALPLVFLLGDSIRVKVMFLSVLSMLFFAGLALYLAVKRRYDWLFFFAVSSIFNAGLGSFVFALSFGTPYEAAVVSRGSMLDMVETQLLLMLGAMLSVWGYFSRVGKKTSWFLPPFRNVQTDPRRLAFVCFALYIAWLFYPYFPRLPSDVLNNFAQNIPLFVLFVGFSAIVTGLWPRKAAVALIILILCPQISWALQGSMKLKFVYPVVACILPSLVVARRLPVLLSFIALFFIVGFVFPFISAVRSGSDRRLIARELATAPRVSYYKDTPYPSFALRFAMIRDVSVIIDLVRKEGHLEGELLKRGAVGLVPRAIWPNKPRVALSRWFAVKLGTGTGRTEDTVKTAQAMTMMGQLYWDFGWIGVFIGMFLNGVLFRALWGTTTRSRGVVGLGIRSFQFLLCIRALMWVQDIGPTCLGGGVFPYILCQVMDRVCSPFAQRDQHQMPRMPYQRRLQNEIRSAQRN